MADTALGQFTENYTKEAISTITKLLDDKVEKKPKEFRKNLEKVATSENASLSEPDKVKDYKKKSAAIAAAGAYDLAEMEYNGVKNLYVSSIKNATATALGEMVDNAVEQTKETITAGVDWTITKFMIGSVIKEDANLINEAASSSIRTDHVISTLGLDTVLRGLSDGIDQHVQTIKETSIANQDWVTADRCNHYLTTSGYTEFYNRLLEGGVTPDVEEKFQRLNDPVQLETRINEYVGIAEKAREVSNFELKEAISTCIQNRGKDINDLLQDTTKKLGQTAIQAIPNAIEKLIKNTTQIVFASAVADWAIKAEDALFKKPDYRQFTDIERVALYHTFDRMDQAFKNLGKKSIEPYAPTPGTRHPALDKGKYRLKNLGIHGHNALIAVLKAPISTTERLTMEAAKRREEKFLKKHNLPIIKYNKKEPVTENTKVKVKTGFLRYEERTISPKELACIQLYDCDITPLMTKIPAEISLRFQEAKQNVQNETSKNPFRKVRAFQHAITDNKQRLKQACLDSVFVHEPWECRMNTRIQMMFAEEGKPDFFFSSVNQNLYVKLDQDLYAEVTKDGIEFTHNDHTAANIRAVTDPAIKGYITDLVKLEISVGAQIGNPHLQYHHSDYVNQIEKEETWQASMDNMKSQMHGYEFYLDRRGNNHEQCIVFTKKGKEALVLPTQLFAADPDQRGRIEKEDLHIRSLTAVAMALDRGLIWKGDQFFGNRQDRTLRISGDHTLEIDHTAQGGRKCSINLGSLIVTPKPDQQHPITSSFRLDNITASLYAANEKIEEWADSHTPTRDLAQDMSR